jgi:hypothetical protein
MESTTVYVVTVGEYSDYRVVGVCSTRETAARLKELHNSDNDVLALELDEFPDTPPGLLRWLVTMRENGDVPEPPWRRGISGGDFLDSASASIHWPGGYVCVKFAVWARDGDHAVKIAGERRRELMASGEWQRMVLNLSILSRKG